MTRNANFHRQKIVFAQIRLEIGTPVCRNKNRLTDRQRRIRYYAETPDAKQTRGCVDEYLHFVVRAITLPRRIWNSLAEPRNMFPLPYPSPISRHPDICPLPLHPRSSFVVNNSPSKRFQVPQWNLKIVNDRRTFYRVVRKTDTQFYFWDNFGNSAPILTILSLLQAEIHGA